MSLQIESLDELKALLKASGLKVNSLEELQNLLAAINANYNPDAARIRVAKLLGVAVPGSLAAAAGVVSVTLAVFSQGLARGAGYALAALAVMWGVCGVVSIVAISLSAALLGSKRNRPAEGTPAPSRPAALPSGADRPTGVTLPDHL
jgi:hypothetical protein